MAATGWIEKTGQMGLAYKYKSHKITVLRKKEYFSITFTESRVGKSKAGRQCYHVGDLSSSTLMFYRVCCRQVIMWLLELHPASPHPRQQEGGRGEE